MNTFGTLFRLTTFGESHGPAIGGIIDGMPAGISVDFDAVRDAMRRRRPGQSPEVTARNESDEVTFLSGIFEGKTLGTPIGFIIPNNDARSRDYEPMRHVYRPGHADYTYDAKYGLRDHRGGGRASARETACRVVAGALASQVLALSGISISARSLRTAEEIAAVKAHRDTIGGIVECEINGVPAGLGEPVFGKLHAMLASAMMSINAAKGFDYGDGVDAAEALGSESVDNFTIENGRITTTANHSGGIQGGISNGQQIYFRVYFKPIATLPRPVDTVTDSLKPTVLEAGGRHDTCVAPRAVPVVEAMAAMTILDAMMLDKARRF